MASSLQRAKSWSDIENSSYLMFMFMHTYKGFWWRDKQGRFRLHKRNKWPKE